MSHFYANIKGNRGEATRQGTKNSGLYGHVRGWNLGALVSVDYNKETEQDEITISLTGGSGGDISGHKLGVWVRKDSGFLRISS